MHIALRFDVTALAGYCLFGRSGDPSAACERMLKAQAIYAPDLPITASTGDGALGRRLFRLLPEDQYDRGPVQTGGWTVVADARLDNRSELADALGLASADIATVPDAALIARAVERWDEEAADRLIGDFAFAAWHQAGARLLLARDFVGQRPLHFYRGGGFFAFASMPKGLHGLSEVPREPDTDNVRSFLGLLPERGTATFYKGIERVPPAHLAVVTRDGVALRRYWQPSRATLRLKSSGEYQEAVREALDRAVAARLRGAGATIASHLSGGLDSSTVTASAARQLGPAGKRVVAYTAVPGVGFRAPERAGQFADESEHAAAVAALYTNVEHVLIRAMARSPLQRLDRNAFLFERPVLNLCNETWIEAILDDAKQRGLQVLLTGQLGNMSFSFDGYERLSALLARCRITTLIREAMALRRNGIGLRNSTARTLGPFLPAGAWLALNRWRGRQLELTDYSLLAAPAAEMVRKEAAEAAHDLTYRPRSDAFQKRLSAIRRVDLGNYNKGMLGGWGIDVRDPTADRRLFELCLSIPLDQYLRNGTVRAIARCGFKDRLPALITDELRKGLQGADWYEGLSGAREDAAEEVERLSGLAAAEGLFDLGRMRTLMSDWPQGDWNSPAVNHAYRLALLRGVSAGHFLRHASGANG